jgi:formate-dependent nitrite reductase membrane component NrfD
MERNAMSMKLYDWMVKPTPQTEWIKRRGILLWLAFFFIELGAGTFFVATFFDSALAMLIGWLICALLGGGAHLLYLGHPLRFWRIVLRPQTSWISRGLTFVGFFLILGLVHMGLWLWAESPLALVIVTDVFAFLVVIYGGFAMNYVNGIALWNTALLPILYVASGIWGGAGLTLATALATGVTTTAITLEEWVRVLLISFIIVLAVYLISVRYSTTIGKFSVREMTLGRWWPLMWFVVVVLGLALPIGVVTNSFVVGLEHVPVAVLYISIFCELIGDLCVRYLILKCGFYSPLISSTYAITKGG